MFDEILPTFSSSVIKRDYHVNCKSQSKLVTVVNQEIINHSLKSKNFE